MLCGDLNEKEIQKWDKWIHIADSLCCKAEMNTTSQSNNTPIKKNKVFLSPLPEFFFFFLGLFSTCYAAGMVQGAVGNVTKQQTTIPALLELTF